MLKHKLAGRLSVVFMLLVFRICCDRFSIDIFSILQIAIFHGAGMFYTAAMMHCLYKL